MKNVSDPHIQMKIDELNQESPLIESSSLYFHFHGIFLKFSSSHEPLLKALKSYLPQSWQQVEPFEDYFSITHHLPKTSREPFHDLESSDVFHYSSIHNIVAVQRDFVASFDPHTRTVSTRFYGDLDDGLHNFFRWFLSPLLISQNKIMIHSAAILNKNKKALVFLGPSGAGKTTITELAGKRTILSDDMNLLVFKGEDLLCGPGGVGGLYKPQVAVDKLFPVERFFWLKQSSDYSLKTLSPLVQHQYLLASFANLPWSRLEGAQLENIFDLAGTILKRKPIEVLEFPKDETVWGKLDP